MSSSGFAGSVLQNVSGAVPYPSWRKPEGKSSGTRPASIQIFTWWVPGHEKRTYRRPCGILSVGGYTYTVEDRGGAIQGNRIDVYMNSHAEALAWGVRYLPVTVVE